MSKNQLKKLHENNKLEGRRNYLRNEIISMQSDPGERDCRER